MEYIKLFEGLEKLQIKYLVCGGLAVNIYGVPRMTADIDLLLSFEEENIQKFESLVITLNYISSIPLKLKSLVSKEERQRVLSEKNLIAYSYNNRYSGYMNLDVLVNTPFEFDELWNRKETRITNSVMLNVVSIEDLIAMKNYANRKQDKDDVLLLSMIKNKNE